ncbi:transmembrane protein [Thraustotheca clavata]|uniref:Transmembrane protein n=1 Tax=Thraustotheca clavata TaxID=74557 RepID=A0A1W0A3B8_9STRA|nr:transmembrane protein [Thraustotheca clavata]
MDHQQRRLSMGMMNSHDAEYLDLANHSAPAYGHLTLEHSHSMGMPHGHYMDDNDEQYDMSGQIVSPKNNAKPSLYKTELCKRFSEYGSCRYGAKCQFAHGMPELRHVLRHPKYKTTKCKSYWGSGHCPYGSRCRFIHEEENVSRGPMYKSNGLSPRNEISPTSQGDMAFLNAQYSSDLPASTGLMSSYSSDLSMLHPQTSPTWLGSEVASTPTFMRSPSDQTFAPKTSPIGPPKKSPSMSNVLDSSVEYNGLQDAIGVLLKFSQTMPDTDNTSPVGVSSPKVGLPPPVPSSSLKSPLKRDLSLQGDELWKDFAAVSISGSGDAADSSDWFLGKSSPSESTFGTSDLREDSSRLKISFLNMTLVVFDYDWSLINDNSDTFIFQQLEPELLKHLKQLTTTGVQWTDAVDQTLSQLTSTTRQELIDTIARVPVQEGMTNIILKLIVVGMLRAVKNAHAAGAEIIIVSDANTVFIESFLELHGLKDIIKNVYTNPGEFEGNILRVRPFHPKVALPHGCPKCPVNMCKGSILKTILAAKDYSKVVYIGDGGGDFCPASQLTSNDYVLAREGFELSKRLAANPCAVNICLWNTGEDIANLFEKYQQNSFNLRNVYGEYKDGALRPPRGSVSIFAWENFGMVIHMAAIGTTYTTISGVIYSVLNNYLHMSATLVATATALVAFPRSLRLFTGMLTDTIPIFGYRRRPYMLLGWFVTFVSCLLMTLLPLGEPYYSDQSIAKIDPDKLTAQQRATIDYDAPQRGVKLIVLMMLANLGSVIATSGFNGVLVDLSQREPVSIRGKAMGETSVILNFFAIISSFFTGLGLNTPDYGGTFSWTITFNGIMGFCAGMALLTLPFTWFCIQEDRIESKHSMSVFCFVYELLQLRMIYRYVAFKFFYNVCALFSVTASNAIQSTWAKVEPFNNGLAGMLASLVAMVGAYWIKKYGLGWNWRYIIIVAQILVVFIDVFPTMLTTWDVVRSQWFWLGVPLLEKLPAAATDLVGSLFILEFNTMGFEATLFGLSATSQRVATPFATMLTKTVDGYLDIERPFIQKDDNHARLHVTIAYVIAYGVNLLGIIFVFLLPPQKEEFHQLQKKGDKNKTWGIVTLCGLVFAILWSLMTNILSLFASTKCLRIAGGSGCKRNKSIRHAMTCLV